MSNKTIDMASVRRTAVPLLVPIIVLSVFSNLLMLTGPLFMLQVYDRVLSSGSEETLLALFVLVAMLYLIMAVLDFSRGRVLARVAVRFQNYLDETVFRNALYNTKQTQHPSTGLRDLETIQQFISSSALIAIIDLPWALLFTAVIFSFHTSLGWLAVGGAVFLAVITFANQLSTRKAASEAQSTAREAQHFSEQMFRSIDLIISQGMPSAVVKRWQALRLKSLSAKNTSGDRSGVFTSFTKSFRLFLQSAMLALGAYLTLQGELSGGAMIAGSILLGRALAPIEQTLGQWPLVQRFLQSRRSLKEILSAAPKELDRTALPKPDASISVNKLTILSKGTRKPIIENVSFKAQPGDVIGVIGSSGSGKTTLAKSLVGITQAHSGAVRLGNAKLEHYDSEVRGSYIGYLPQEVTLFSGTIKENISRLAIDPCDEAITRAARAANAHELILGLPNAYETVIDGQNVQLSGGEKQRIALARALYNDPLVLVLDEPNSALDGLGSEALNDAIDNFKEQNRTVIIITHRPIASCNMLAVMERGKLKAFGPTEAVMKAIVDNAQGVEKIIRGVKS